MENGGESEIPDTKSNPSQKEEKMTLFGRKR